jgi:predicted nucleic acid-binding protein
MSTPTACLVDSNVLVYTQDPRDPAAQRTASDIIRRLADRNRIVLSAQCLTEFYYAVTRRLPNPLPAEDAMAGVQQLTTFAARVYPITVDVVLEAIAAVPKFQMSLWDALIWSVAFRNGVPLILSEDTPSRPSIDGVRYINPFVPDFDIESL